MKCKLMWTHMLGNFWTACSEGTEADKGGDSNTSSAIEYISSWTSPCPEKSKSCKRMSKLQRGGVRSGCSPCWRTTRTRRLNPPCPRPPSWAWRSSSWGNCEPSVSPPNHCDPEQPPTHTHKTRVWTRAVKFTVHADFMLFIRFSQSDSSCMTVPFLSFVFGNAVQARDRFVFVTFRFFF